MRIELPDPRKFARLFESLVSTSFATQPTGIATDNREIRPGDLFLALPGEKVDSHGFVAPAARSGAVAALVTHTVATDHPIQQCVVESVVHTMGDLARQWRQAYSIPIIGVTGTNGKTTTKELVRHFLSAKGRVHATEGNFNTSIGLPLTLLTLEEKHSFSILEMGANQPGDIEYLTELAQPTHGIITNIAPAHLAGFGTVDGVLNEKARLLTAPGLEVAFLNVSDPRCASIKPAARTVTFGFDPAADYSAENESVDPGVISINGHNLRLSAPNPALKKNVLAAATVARTLGVPWTIIQRLAPKFPSVAGRCQIRKMNGYTVIDDTYNANVESTQTALGFLTEFSDQGRKIFIFGDMFEMGDMAEEAHAQVGRICLDTPLAAVFTVGKYSEIITRIASARYPSFHFKTKARLAEQLLRFCQPGDVLLIKGSRGMAMETIISELETR